jgi:hypothetical protein
VVDIAQERHKRAEEVDASRRWDLDETRRVAYMALLCRKTEHYELAATLVNALAHHGLAVDPKIAASHIVPLVEGKDDGKSERWLERQIEHITAELDS